MKPKKQIPLSAHRKRRRSFTLVEILVVLGIITTLAGTVPLSLNYTGQMNKALDTRRKTDLNTLSKALEDYQNDNQSYPLGPTLCFDTPQTHDSEYNTCIVCGRELAKQSFPPYLTQLPCDPQYAARNYLYVYDTNVGAGSSKYVLCARLSTVSGTDGYYNYGVASPDVNPNICKTIALSG